MSDSGNDDDTLMSSNFSTEFEPVAAASALFGAPSGTNGARRYSSIDVAQADDHGLLGIVDVGVGVGLVDLDADAAAMMAMLLRRASEEAVALESRTVAATIALSEVGVDSTVLKGVAVAHLDYPFPEMRHFGDVDLLVGGSDMETAVTALEATGFARHYDEPYDGFDEHIGKGVAVEDAEGTVLDLHRTLALGYFGTRLPVAELWERRDRFDVAGTSLRALGRTARFVHAALHMALSPTQKLANGLDLCMIASRPSTIDANEVIDVSRRWHCAAPVAHAIRSTADRFGDTWASTELIRWSLDYRPTAGERLALAAFDGPFSGSAARSLTAVAGLRSASLVRRATVGLIAPRHGERE